MLTQKFYFLFFIFFYQKQLPAVAENKVDEMFLVRVNQKYKMIQQCRTEGNIHIHLTHL